MKKFLTKAVGAAFVGLTGLVGVAPTVSAQSLTLEFGPGGVQYRDHDRYDRRDRPRYGYERRGRCAPWLAVDKARDRGLRRAHVADVSHRRVVVEGRRRGERQAIIFANVRGCPIIGRW